MNASDETLVTMANQIARFFQTQRHESAALGVADHIAAFWASAMHRRLYAAIDAGVAVDPQGRGLTPLALAGLATLRHRGPAALGRELEHQGGVSFTQERGSDAG